MKIHPKEIYDLLLESSQTTELVREVLIGLTWTFCQAEGIGLCMSPGQPTRTLPWAGTLVNKAIAQCATGDMLRILLPDGRRRRLTVREGARLQSFPDWFEFQGSENSQFNQIGNAVPPLLAKALARSVMAYLDKYEGSSSEEMRSHNQYIQRSLNLA